jgi:ribosomal protein S18 acetylase RimI-like enzyme
VEIRLERLTTDSLHDFLDYFDHRAFLRDEDWAGCYCQAYLYPPSTPAEEIFGPGKARQAACDRVAEGKMDGYLAYSEQRVVGWCAAGQGKLFGSLPEAEDSLARIVCFNVDPDLRQQGLASTMLDLVLQDLEAREFTAVEAAPLATETSDRSFQGTVSMFSSRGFERVVDMPNGAVLMRRYFD